MKRLGLNTDGYRGERVRIREVLEATLAIADARGWERIIRTEPGGLSLCFLHRPAVGVDPSQRALRLYLSTGIHGDEPAGPLALQALLQSDAFPKEAECWICPCLNPTGCERVTRENHMGIDLNRDYRSRTTVEVRLHTDWLETLPTLDLTLLLHEDWEAGGFYLYELNRTGRLGLAEAMVEAVRPLCPLETAEFVDGRPMSAPGIIRPEVNPDERVDWPEALWLLENKTGLSYTLEAPSDFPLAQRTQALVKATIRGMEEMVRGAGFEPATPCV